VIDDAKEEPSRILTGRSSLFTFKLGKDADGSDSGESTRALAARPTLRQHLIVPGQVSVLGSLRSAVDAAAAS